MGTDASRTVRERYHAAAVLPNLASAYWRLLRRKAARETQDSFTRT
jgi:hypothetical protein